MNTSSKTAIRTARNFHQDFRTRARGKGACIDIDTVLSCISRRELARLPWSLPGLENSPMDRIGPKSYLKKLASYLHSGWMSNFSVPGRTNLAMKSSGISADGGTWYQNAHRHSRGEELSEALRNSPFSAFCAQGFHFMSECSSDTPGYWTSQGAMRPEGQVESPVRKRSQANNLLALSRGSPGK